MVPQKADGVPAFRLLRQGQGVIQFNASGWV
jgi:hypothetical protein